MHSCTLYKLHNAGDKHILTIADGIYLNLLTSDVMIDQNRFILIYLNRSPQILPQLLFICNYPHRSAAKHEAGSDKYRISYLSCYPAALINIRHCLALRLVDVKPLHQLVEFISILCSVNRRAIGADNVDTALIERTCKVDSCLSSKGYYYTFGLLKSQDIHNILDA